MKKVYLMLFAFATIISCQKDEKSIFIPRNHLEEFQTEKTQIFDLDTLEFKQIVGKHGTKINFLREGFDVSKNEKITLELIELYDFKEILFRNMNTITNKNELLETNGVLYISFKSNGKEIELKESKKLAVFPPKGKLKDNDIFIAKKDSLDNIKWEIRNQDFITITEKTSYGGGIFVTKEKLIHKDSIANYNKRLKTRENLLKSNKTIRDYFTLQNGDFGYINIDRIVNVDSKVNFTLIEKKQQISGFNIYFTYKDLKSFIYNARLKDELKFNEIPISGKTWITVIGEKNGILYYDKIELKKELNNSKIILEMKKTTTENLKNILTN